MSELWRCIQGKLQQIYNVVCTRKGLQKQSKNQVYLCFFFLFPFKLHDEGLRGGGGGGDETAQSYLKVTLTPDCGLVVVRIKRIDLVPCFIPYRIFELSSSLPRHSNSRAHDLTPRRIKGLTEKFIRVI
jgi:hypothetical protein